MHISSVLVFFASLRLENNYLEKKDRHQYQRSPSICVAHNLSRLVIVIIGAVICLSANAGITSTLRSNWPEGEVRSEQRELGATATYSFAYTGAVQTWY